MLPNLEAGGLSFKIFIFNMNDHIQMCLFEIKDGLFKLELFVNLLFIVIIDVGFACKCLSTANCYLPPEISAKTDHNFFKIGESKINVSNWKSINISNDKKILKYLGEIM